MEKSCKEHPYHDQKQGVCPSCLREKLSQIYAVAETTTTAAADDHNTLSWPSNSMTSSSSTLMSPLHDRDRCGHHRHRRMASDVTGGDGSVSFKVGSDGYGLKKSRSVAFVSRNLNNIVGEVKNGKNKKKKKGFWSKLLHFKGKKDVGNNFDGKIALKGFA